MTRLMVSDISPDGVRIVVDWSKFTSGASVFIPCVNTKRAIDHVAMAVGLPKSNLEKRVRVEDGKYGVRGWRMK